MNLNSSDSKISSLERVNTLKPFASVPKTNKGEQLPALADETSVARYSHNRACLKLSSECHFIIVGIYKV